MCMLSRLVLLASSGRLCGARAAVNMPPKGTKRKERAGSGGEAAEGDRVSPDDEPPPAKRGRGRPRKADAGAAAGASASAKKPRPKKGAESTDRLAVSKPAAASGSKTDWDAVDWAQLGQTKDGRPGNIKFSTWNVNGIRAWLKNGGFEYLAREDPDIFCVQETKCCEADLPKDKLEVPGYHTYWYSAETKGYSGTGLYTKVKPISVTYGMGIEAHDKEGRLITAEFDKFYFLTSYVPNAGEGLKRLSYRQEWDVDFRAYLKRLDQTKPLLLCGDLNVAHTEIDLTNPKTNLKTAGFTVEERENFTALLAEGFVDSFRHFHPDQKQAYTYWSYRFNARAKNIGWRLDYFVVSERLMKDVCDCTIRSGVYASDHCPLVVTLALD